MMLHVEENRSRNSVSNALAYDVRFSRVSRTEWGLASWGLPEYAGIAESIRNLIEEFGGAINIDVLVHRMSRMFGVAENSTLAYCSAPMFVIDGALLRLRTQHDEPYRQDPDSIRRTPGVFHLGPMRLGRLLKVDGNMLRGSGTILTHAASTILAVEVNGHLSFSNGHGDTVDITFPETSLIGPTIGSVRRIAERLSAKEGDYLTLVLDRPTMTVASILTDLRGRKPGWDAIGRLTGIDPPVDFDTLSGALRCHAGEVRRVLAARGDDEVLDMLPKFESSGALENALLALEAYVEKARGGSQ